MRLGIKGAHSNFKSTSSEQLSRYRLQRLSKGVKEVQTTQIGMPTLKALYTLYSPTCSHFVDDHLFPLITGQPPGIKKKRAH